MTTVDFTNWEKKIPRHPVLDRDAFILDKCRARQTIHLGACDAPMTRVKAEKGELLHQKLQGVASELVGYDNDAASIEILSKDFGIDDIVCRDLSKNQDGNAPSAEVVVCADIIEHVNNVGTLIETCRDVLQDDGELVLSTINAVSIKQTMRGFVGREPVHPDHIAYYSFATLGTLLSRFGLILEECRYFKYETVSALSGFFFNALYTVAPQSADGIVVTARKRSAK